MAAALGSFLVFFVTPVGLEALGAAVVFLVLVAFLRVIVGAVSTVWKTRGLEWPVCERVPSRAIFPVVNKL